MEALHDGDEHVEQRLAVNSDEHCGRYTHQDEDEQTPVRHG